MQSYAGEAAQQEPNKINGNTGNQAPKGSWRNACSLKGTIVLGDSVPDEDHTFGNSVEDPWCTLVRTQMCQISVKMTQQMVLSIPVLMVMAILSALPVNRPGVSGVPGVTGFTTAINAFLVFVLNSVNCVAPLVWADHGRAPTTIGWATITLMPLIIGNTLLKWNMQMQGKPDTSQTMFWNFPGIFVGAIAYGKMNTVPGWCPKWNTSCCVCGGITRAIGTCCLYYVAGGFATLALATYMYWDNVVFSLNTSLAMAFLRPLMFFTAKKLVYAIFALMSNLRHPMITKSATGAASVILGFATAVAFTKTRNWTGLAVFVLFSWFAHGSRMWTFTGAKHSTSCFMFRWYKAFMVSGKPIASSGKMKLRDLRGFENMSQSWGTTFGMALFLAFYPIVKIWFGEDSMPTRFFFPTNLSFIFLCIAYFSELVLDLHTQITTIHGTKCDYEGLFTLKPRSPMVCGILFLNAYVASGMNVAWDRERLYQVDQGTEADFR